MVLPLRNSHRKRVPKNTLPMLQSAVRGYTLWLSLSSKRISLVLVIGMFGEHFLVLGTIIPSNNLDSLTLQSTFSARELDEFMKSDRHSEQEKNRQLEKARSAEARYLRFLRTKEEPDNFITVKKIGKGAFGEVKLVTRVKDGKIYALKSLNKAEMFKKDQLAHVRAERDILAESDSPWVVKLYTTFQDKSKLYMLMEFLPGGDLMTMLIKYEIFSIPITRFYIAEIILAIEAVHKHGFIHR